MQNFQDRVVDRIESKPPVGHGNELLDKLPFDSQISIGGLEPQVSVESGFFFLLLYGHTHTAPQIYSLRQMLWAFMQLV